MEIGDILKESVTTMTLKSKGPKSSARPSMRALQEGGFGYTTGTAATAEAEEEEDKDEDDDADAEGGRFFEDGLTTSQKQVFQWVDNLEAVDTLDRAQIQRLLHRLDRCVQHNTQQRIKYPQQPAKFADSEADLDECLQSLLPLASQPHLLAELRGALETLTQLLAHENADIALDVIQLVNEATNEDETETQEVVGFVRELGGEFFELLGQNLRRLDEFSENAAEAEADRQGVFLTLGLVENLVSLDMGLAEPAIESMRLMEWLANRVNASREVDSNQQYAAELVSIVIQSSPALLSKYTDQLADVLLQALSHYQSYSPVEDSETEMEYFENIVDSLCALAATAQGKQQLADLDGIELLVRMQKQPQHVGRLLSVKILDYLLSPPDTQVRKEIALKYIDGRGAKYLVSVLLRRPRQHRKWFKRYPQIDTHAVSCLAWLFQLTDKETPAHWRVLAKFIPSEIDPTGWQPNVDRLVELNIQYGQTAGDQYALQMTGAILLSVSQDPEARRRIEDLLARNGRSLETIEEDLLV